MYLFSSFISSHFCCSKTNLHVILSQKNRAYNKECVKFLCFIYMLHRRRPHKKTEQQSHKGCRSSYLSMDLFLVLIRSLINMGDCYSTRVCTYYISFIFNSDIHAYQRTAHQIDLFFTCKMECQALSVRC